MEKRGRGHKKEKKRGRGNNNSNPKVAINISIPQKLLANIEQHITGNNRSAKVTKCAEKGFFELKGQFMEKI